jgi:hypothetical protein
MSILILSTSNNAHANAVEKTLRDMNEITDRINMDRAFEDTAISFYDCKTTGNLKIKLNGRQISDISGVFFHQANVSIPDNFVVDEIDSTLCCASWNGIFPWLETCLSIATWVNRPSISRVASSNSSQLALAKRLGFMVPKTIFTNDLNLVFLLAEQGKVILKTGTLHGLNLDGKSILTQVIDPNKLVSSDLKTAPCLFQQYIEKAYELRVYVVGDKVLSFRIESQANETTKTDWRKYNLKQTPHYAHNLSKNIEEKCLILVKNLGLEFGAIDLIVTPQDETVFLECNTQGHWLWIEELTGLPITKAVCSLLAKR